MQKFLSSYKENKKIFLGDTDSYTIIQNGYTKDDLILKIKIATLLYDAIFIPAVRTNERGYVPDSAFNFNRKCFTNNKKK